MSWRKDVLLRVKTLLEAIDGVAGVTMRMMSWEETKGFPWLMVFSGGTHGVESFSSPQSWKDTMEVIIRGYVKETAIQDAVLEMEDLIEKIRAAIHDDYVSNATGSLGVMELTMTPGEVRETDSGVLSDVGLAFFELAIPISRYALEF